MNTTYAALLLMLLAGCSPVEEAPDLSDTDTDTDSGEAVAESEVGSPEVAIYGSLGDIFSKGDFSAKVGLDEIGDGPGLIALGRLSELRGEIAILDGQIWLATAQDGGVQVQQSQHSSEQATLLVVSDVSEWVSFTVEQDTTLAELDMVVADMLQAANWPDTGALPVKVQGAIEQVQWQVMDGAQLPEEQPTHEEFDAAGIVGTLEGGDPVLLGFYSTQHAGVITHGGVRLHLHVIDADQDVSGHVQDALIGAGSVVSFPAP